MNRKKTHKLVIDYDLTPENAADKGYEWYQDVIYDEDQPYYAMKDIIDAVEKHGCKLGSSASVMASEIYTGLYMPKKK